MTDPDRLLAGDVDHLTGSPDGLDDGNWPTTARRLTAGERFVIALNYHADLIPPPDELSREAVQAHRELLASVADARVEVRRALRARTVATLVGIAAVVLAATAVGMLLVS